MEEQTIDYTEHIPEITEHTSNLAEQLEAIKNEIEEAGPTFVEDDTKFTFAPTQPVYKLKHLETLPSKEFIVDLLNSMRVHVHGETDVYENHTDMFEDAE